MVCNPISGKGSGPGRANVARQFLERRGLDRLTIKETASSGDARRFAAAVAHDHDLLLSIGGDGTLNEVMSGVCHDRPDLPTEERPAILPVRAGTSNIMSMELGIPPRVEESLKLLQSGRVLRVDRGLLNETASFLLWAGMGLDGEIVHRVMKARRGPMNKFSYCLPALKTLASYRLPQILVRVDDRDLEGTFGQVLVANAQIYAAFLRLSSRASLASGRMVVIGLRATRPVECLRFAWACLRRRSDTTDAVIVEGKRIEVRGQAAPPPVQIDGDARDLEALDIQVIPRDVPLLVPRETSEALDPNKEPTHAFGA